MDLMEYQAKELFAKHGVPVLPGETVDTAEAARGVAERIGKPVVVKAQVKTGGRGKAGGVKLAETPDEAVARATDILGLDIKGHVVEKILVTEASDIATEYYVSFLLDRSDRTYLAMASVEGGVEIEQLAVEKPEALARVAVDALVGCDEAKAREIVETAGFPDDVADEVAAVLVSLWKVFVGEEATLVEVNPLVKTPDGRIVALDGKVTLDANAEFRHTEVFTEYADTVAEDDLEGRAKAKNLNYVKLDGQVGIIGNGAGLVMSTLDVVAYAGEAHGGVKPANFLDIGGGASAEVMGERAGDHPVRPGRQECVRQRVRRDHLLRRGRQRHRQRAGDPGRRGHQAARRAAGRQQRGGGAGDPQGREPPARHGHGHDGRSGRQGRGAGRSGMSIFLNADSRIIVQGITGSEGTKHTRRMVASGSQVVGGVNPRKAGSDVDGIPVFATVAEARKETDADVSVLFVPPPFARAAVEEAVDAGIGLAVVITEGIPVQDSAAFWQYCQDRAHSGGTTRIIGPNCPGLISPGSSNAGIIPATITPPGRVGLVSKSGTLTYQMMYELRDFGFSTAVGIGGDPVVGTTHIDCLQAFQDDPDTDAIVMIGEIGGDAEERAAAYIKDNITKPVVGYVAGFTAPEGKTMGHAGAIVSGSSGTAQAKQDALEAAGVRVGKTPSATAQLMREIMQSL